MINWILRKTRTKTSVHTPGEAALQREAGRASALGAVAAVQLGMQLLLWITFFAYDRAVQATWQAALIQLVPMLVLWFVFSENPHPYAALLLLPCLTLDAAFILRAFGGLMDALLPEYPYGLGAAVCALTACLTLLFARPNGVAYGSSVLKWPLVLCFLLGTVLLRASNRADRLWPVLGPGVGQTALAALGGTGAAWGAALTRALPGRAKPKWFLIPWGVGLIWALWYGFLRPWSPGDALDIGEKMMGLARNAGHVVNFQLAGLLWLIAQPVALTGSAMTGEWLLSRAFPRLPRLLLCAAVILPAFVLSRFDFWLPALAWRGLWALLAGVVLMILRRKERAK